MANLRRNSGMHNVLWCIYADSRKRAFATSVRKEKGAESSHSSLQPIKMSYASYESVKTSDLSSNVPIIIMHGLLGSKNNWNSLSKVIHNRTRRKVIAVDARNHGDSPHTPTMSYPLMTEDVRQLMVNLNIPKATVVGHSMGGRTMMLFALKYPALVDELVVADISPVRNSPNLEVMPLYLQALQNVHLDSNQSLPTARQQADQQLALHVKEKTLRQFFVSNLVETEKGMFGWRMNVGALQTNFKELAIFPSVNESFSGPTIFIGGGESDFIKREDHEPIKKIFPNAAFDYIEGAGHWLHSEKPSEFLEIICKFLNERN